MTAQVKDMNPHFKRKEGGALTMWQLATGGNDERVQINRWQID